MVARTESDLQQLGNPPALKLIHIQWKSLYLQTLEAERRGSQTQSLGEHGGRSFGKPKLRLLRGGL
jgi:hypothetical protein